MGDLVRPCLGGGWWHKGSERHSASLGRKEGVILWGNRLELRVEVMHARLGL